jgi:hypothetical protein
MLHPSFALAAAAVLTSAASAGGHLWLGAEFAAEGKVFRYDIDAGVIDLTLTPTLPPGASHFNNMATDGVHVYYGSPTTQWIGVADIHTGIVIDELTYSPSAAGHKEDGAFNPQTGTLWRVTFSDLLHEVSADGAVLNTWSGVGALVGLEWVGGTLYSTNYSGGAIGRINFTSATTAEFIPIPWARGAAPAASTAAALAYDDEDDVLYMMTYSDAILSSVTFADDKAFASVVKDLNAVGLPEGVLVDGMGWDGVPGTSNPCPADLNDDGQVDGADLGLLLSNWNGAGLGDLDDSATVDGADLGLLLAAWGEC